jgi:hypothetical protein
VPIRQEPIFGWGGWGNARTDLATDSAFLIWALSRGLVSASLMFGYYVLAMHACIRTANRYRGTPLADILLAVSLLLGVSFALSMVDDALDTHVALLASSVLGLEAALRRGVAAPAAGGLPAAGGAPGYVYSK